MRPTVYSKIIISACGEGFQRLQNPFMFPLTQQGLLRKQYKELIHISTDMTLKNMYTEIYVINFWGGRKGEFLYMYSVAVTKLLAFPSMYLCKTFFLKIHSIKNEILK
jgi:hypothetical protein